MKFHNCNPTIMNTLYSLVMKCCLLLDDQLEILILNGLQFASTEQMVIVVMHLCQVIYMYRKDVVTNDRDLLLYCSAFDSVSNARNSKFPELET